jgi:hypothetical protein
VSSKFDGEPFYCEPVKNTKLSVDPNKKMVTVSLKINCIDIGNIIGGCNVKGHELQASATVNGSLEPLFINF